MPATKRQRRRNYPEAATLPKRSHDLYYLFAGMAHGSRKRYVRNVILSLAVGVVVSGSLAGLLYFVYKP